MNNDLISREALKKQINDVVAKDGDDFSNDLLVGLDMAFQIIDNAPTVEPVFPTIKVNIPEERPQGEWIEYNATGKKQYMCSECGMKEKNPKIARYCYWCGAEMRKGDAK